MKVTDVMSTGVETIDPNTTVRDAAIRMRDRDLGALAVGEADKLLGMVTDRDIVTRATAADRAGGTTAVRDVMSKSVYCCFDDDPVERAAEVMAQHKVRRIPVVDRDQNLVGMVSLADLSHGGAEGARSVTDTLRTITDPTPHAPRT